MGVDRRSVVGLGLGAAFAGAAQAAAQEIVASRVFENDQGGRFAAAIRDIDDYAADHVAAHGLPGLTVTVVGPGGFVGLLQRGYANVERRTPVAQSQLFQIGSISKSFTALCIFRLMEAGKLRLEDPVLTHLPEVPLPANGGITVQALLSHSSGLPDDAPMFPRGGDQRLWQGFPVGAQWSYSNLGYELLGRIVERLAGRPLAEVIALEVLRPLGMAQTRPAIVTADRALYATGYSPLYSDRPAPRGGPLAPGAWTEMVEGSGCVASTAADMARYVRWLVAAGQGKGAPLLSDAGAQRFCAAVIDAPGWASPGAKYANGLALTPVGGRMLLHHTGGMLTFNSSIHVDPAAGVGCFASTNVGMIPYRPRGLTAYACARMRDVVEGRASEPPPPSVPSLPDLGAFHGGYVGRSSPLEIGPGARGLVATLGDERIELEPAGPDAFAASDPRQASHLLVFRRQADRVVRAWWGESEYVRREGGRASTAFSPPPPELASLAGHYENDDPWRGGFRVTVQGDRLMVDGVTPTTPIPGGGFRVGDKDWSPERLRFDGDVAGRPTRATLSGVDYVRRPT
jgi:CubicO group peptidase (beta-lactamase class C family)